MNTRGEWKPVTFPGICAPSYNESPESFLPLHEMFTNYAYVGHNWMVYWWQRQEEGAFL